MDGLADGLLNALRHNTNELSKGNLDVADQVARDFIKLDIEIMSGRPPAGWSLSKFSKTKVEVGTDDPEWDGTGAW